MAKKLAFKQCLHHSRAVQHHKFSSGRAESVQRLSNQVFSRACFSRDEGRPIMRSNAADASEHLPHLRAPANHAFELSSAKKSIFNIYDLLPLKRSINQTAAASRSTAREI